MSDVRWGGAFVALDGASSVRIEGKVYGLFRGRVPVNRVAWLSVELTRNFEEILNQAVSAASLLSHTDLMAQQLHELVAEELKHNDVEGDVIVQGVKLTPECEAVLKTLGVAAPQNPPAGTPSIAPPPIAVSSHVMVLSSDGKRYPAVVAQEQNGQFLVRFATGQQQWVSAQYIQPV